MKRFFLFLCLVCLTASQAIAQSFSVDGLSYTITSDVKPYTVAVMGYDYSSPPTDLVIPASVTYEGIAYAVTSIGNLAFYGCSSLTSITISNGVTSIGEGAFCNCYSLTSITIPDGVTSIGDYAFSGVLNIIYNGTATGSPWGARSMNGYLEGFLLFESEAKTQLLACSTAATGEIIVPNSVTSIGNSAFQGCSGLTSITIPDGVTSIGGSAFQGCSGLTSITIPESVTSIGGYAFYGCAGLTSVTIGDGVTSIGNSAFQGCSGLTSITIPENVTSIGQCPFFGCSSLTSVVWNAINCNDCQSNSDAPFLYDYISSLAITSFIFGDRVEHIPAWVCYGMNNLTSLIIPESVTSIGWSAFNGCSGLTSITIPAGVTSIGWGAFANCSGITSVNVEEGNGNYDSRDNCNAVIEISSNTLIVGCENTIIPESVTNIGGAAFCGCSGLTFITLPESVTNIGGAAFCGCSGLTFITLPESITSIGEDAFSWCTGLTSITLPKSVTSIGYSTFRACSGLTSITIPDGVTSIGSYAFSGCSGLTSITIPDDVTSIGERAFLGCSGLTSITIPDGVTSISLYAFGDVLNIVYHGSATGSPWGARSVNGYIDGYLVYESEAKTQLITCSTSAIGELILPESVTSIGERAFLGCSGLTSITIPDGVTSIGSSTFYSCSGLTSITISDSVTSIGNSAFYNCASLASLTIPDGVTSIGEYAFSGCSGLTSVTIGKGVRSIGSRAFEMCNSISSVVWNAETCVYDNSKEFLGTGGGYYVGPFSLIKDNYNINDNTSITSFVFGKDVKEIPEGLCCFLTSLSSITIPDGVTSIGDYAFFFCYNVTSPIVIPNSVTHIGQSAFLQCKNLPSVIIGSNVESIGDHAFALCCNLASVTSLASTPPTLIGTPFNSENDSYYCSSHVDCSLYVPCGRLEAYQAASGWDWFTDMQEPPTPSYIVQSGNLDLGYVQTEGEVEGCGDTITISATSTAFGYHFAQWSDGNTDNPRILSVTQDTVLTAEFALTTSGKCGDDLYWQYHDETVDITGTGAMYNYTESTQPWLLLKDSIKTVRTGHFVTSIGESAFAQTIKLAKLYIGAGMENIAANAFAGCQRLYDIYCYPTYPPFAETTSFANYNVYLYVPCEVKRDYTLDIVWGLFRYIECIGSDDVVLTSNEVTVTPTTDDATFTWPTDDSAETYTLVITKDGVVFCTLVFNANGQLTTIAFKPSRQRKAALGNSAAQQTYATATANGFRFTVTGLDEDTHYAYTLTIRDAANAVLTTYEGDFTTESNTPTGTLTADQESPTVQKIFHNGQVLILRDGKAYNLLGQEVR